MHKIFKIKNITNINKTSDQVTNEVFSLDLDKEVSVFNYKIGKFKNVIQKQMISSKKNRIYCCLQIQRYRSLENKHVRKKRSQISKTFFVQDYIQEANGFSYFCCEKVAPEVSR